MRLSQDFVLNAIIFRISAVIDHVPYVSNILHAMNAIASNYDESSYEVCQHEGTQISDMGISINGRSTAIHAQGLAIADLDLFLFSAHGVVEPYTS